MWIDNIGKVEQLIKEMGSPYVATLYIARKARELRTSCYCVISDSQAVEWAISGILPENLSELIKQRMRKEEGIPAEDHLDSVLATIDEDNIRIAVLNSYKLSMQNKQMMFDYNGIKDKGIRTRIRILTRMVVIPEFTHKK